jgi:hypothetical protein
MPRAKSSEGKRRRKAVRALSAVGALSLAGSAAANALGPTIPVLTGSAPVWKTIGMVEVAALAAELS